jgi:hypothetical protein
MGGGGVWGGGPPRPQTPNLPNILEKLPHYLTFTDTSLQYAA